MQTPPWLSFFYQTATEGKQRATENFEGGKKKKIRHIGGRKDS